MAAKKEVPVNQSARALKAQIQICMLRYETSAHLLLMAWAANKQDVVNKIRLQGPELAALGDLLNSDDE